MAGLLAPKPNAPTAVAITAASARLRTARLRRWGTEISNKSGLNMVIDFQTGKYALVILCCPPTKTSGMEGLLIATKSIA